MSISPIKVGLIGSGAISCTYLDTLVNTFDIVEVVGCSDLLPQRSASRAETFGIRQMTNEQIFEDPEIQIVVNTTYPISHYEVTRGALLAGKHVHSEKMMAENFDRAKELVELAEAKGLRIGMAPDTFLGGGLQTCRKLIDSGMIGQPVSAQAMVVRGYHWTSPNDGALPPFVLNEGGTIPFDMGGYYIHALVHLLGPVRRVAGFARPYEKKVFSHPMHPRYGQPLNLTPPTLLQASLEFDSGVYGGLSVVGECFGETPRLEIYGTEGTLICPDPNTYGGPVLLRTKNSDRFYEIPLTHGYGAPKRASLDKGGEIAAWAGSYRGVGVADMAWAIRNNRPHRCSALLGLHALEIIHGTLLSAREDRVYTMTTHPAQPAPLPSGFGGADEEACLDT
ncbi:MAG: Gfo/Idh/MocA family protein [Christensenellales bacterium]|jgi:predicted dehydrogenase